MQIKFCDVAVVGSGAAGLAAAARLSEAGLGVVLITEDMNAGTSRNTGSDKQTYYKLSLAGSDRDSVLDMARDLFAGGAVDGDNALCEAALSTRCFYALTEGGIPFPHNDYGEYIGYKTDHDPYRRATSAGPLTSRYMTEMWEKRVTRAGVTILDGYLAVEIVRDADRVCGLMLLEKASGRFCAICAPYVILATGGPAGIYADSVYPVSQHGSLGLAAEAGITLQNLTEWQYGLSSIAPRWNVSGTYMQVLPRFVSVDAAGIEREFLLESLRDPYEALSLVFLKGYQWPFDCRKVMGSSSLIDLLVFRERAKGRRVYLDYTANPFGLERVDASRLSDAARTYLLATDACFGRPIDRLLKMNTPAVELYRSKGIDLTVDRLEIALCAQHHNGGIAVDASWMTDLDGLFAIGECAGTHGITRPGGSALNAGQVGALRATQFITAHKRTLSADAESAIRAAEMRHRRFAEQVVTGGDTARAILEQARRRMSDCAAAIRSGERIRICLQTTQALLDHLHDTVKVCAPSDLHLAYRCRETLWAQAAVLNAMEHYDACGYSSRGSAILCDTAGVLPPGLDEQFRFRLSEVVGTDAIQELCRTGTDFFAQFRPVRPIPCEDEAFETVWRRYREMHTHGV